MIRLRNIRLICLLCAAVYCAPDPAAIRPALASEADGEEANCLATALYWETGAEGEKAMIAVAWVVLNRIKSPDFPDTVCKVVREGGEKPGCQFSYRCDGKPDIPQKDKTWSVARSVAVRMLENPPKDPTGGALFFHAVNASTPWAAQRKRTAQIGDHVFYR